jgi:hypothetical protein
MNTTKLKMNIETVQKSIEEYKTILKNNANDFTAQLTLRSLDAHRRDLSKQLRNEMLIHSKEIMEIHLTGKSVKNGNVPLKIMAEIAQSFSRAIQTASVRIENGYDLKRIPEYIENLLSLSLVGLSYGSARIIISADSNPDLFGSSLADKTLQKTFEILNYEDIDSFLDNIDLVGIKSLKNWHMVFNRCLSENVEMDFSWMDSDAEQHIWNGNNEKLQIWKKRIEMIKSRDLGLIDIPGTVFLISLSGRLELLREDGSKIKSIFPSRMLKDIESIGINDKVVCSFFQKQVIDMSKGIEKITYTLENIRPDNT